MDARQCTVVFGNPKSSIRMHIMKGSSCRAAHARVRGGRPAPKALSQDKNTKYPIFCGQKQIGFFISGRRQLRHYLRTIELDFTISGHVIISGHTYSVLRTKNMKHKACHYLRTKHFEKYLRTQNWIVLSWDDDSDDNDKLSQDIFFAPPKLLRTKIFFGLFPRILGFSHYLRTKECAKKISGHFKQWFFISGQTNLSLIVN